MVFTVLVLGGTMLGATTIGGLLLLYQIRQTTDMANSAKAIFAADAAIEWGRYAATVSPSRGHSAQPVFSNGAESISTCYADAEMRHRVDCEGEPVMVIVGTGRAKDVRRAFLLPL